MREKGVRSVAIKLGIQEHGGRSRVPFRYHARKRTSVCRTVRCTEMREFLGDPTHNEVSSSATTACSTRITTVSRAGGTIPWAAGRAMGLVMGLIAR